MLENYLTKASHDLSPSALVRLTDAEQAGAEHAGGVTLSTPALGH